MRTPGPDDQGTVYQHLPPHLMALKERMAKPQATHDFVEVYFTGDNAFKTPDEIAEEQKAFYAQASQPAPGLAQSGMTDAPWAQGIVGNGLTMGQVQPGQAQGQAPQQGPGVQTVGQTTLPSGQYQNLEAQLQALLAQRPGASPDPQLQGPNQWQALAAVLAALANPDQASQALSAPLVYGLAEQDRQRQANAAQDALAREDWAGLVKIAQDALARQTDRDVAQARLDQGNEQFNAEAANRYNLGLEQIRGRSDVAAVNAGARQTLELMKQAFGADSPEARAEAARQYEALAGRPLDAAAVSALSPAEQLTLERATTARETRAHVVRRLQAEAGVSEQQALWWAKRVENYDKELAARLALLAAQVERAQAAAQAADKPDDTEFFKRLGDQIDRNLRYRESLQKDRGQLVDQLTGRNALFMSAEEKAAVEAQVKEIERRIKALDEEIEEVQRRMTDGPPSGDGYLPLDPTGGGVTLPGGVRLSPTAPPGKVKDAKIGGRLRSMYRQFVGETV